MPPRRRWTLVATIIGSSLAFIDATVVNVALPALQTALHASLTEVQERFWSDFKMDGWAARTWRITSTKYF